MNNSTKKESLKKLANIIEEIPKEQINDDYPLLLIMIGIIIGDVSIIQRLKNSIAEDDFFHYVNKPLISSSWTLAVLYGMGYRDEIELFLPINKSDSPIN